MEINNKKIDLDTITIDGVWLDDYPKFCDAYISGGYDANGKELTEDDIIKIEEEYPEIINQLAHESLI